MTGPAHEAHSGDAERRYGYVNFGDVVEAIRLANEPQTKAIEHLEATFRRELQAQTATLARRIDLVEGRTAELEEWHDAQDDAALVRQGKLAVTLGAVRIVAANYRVVWAVVVFLLGMMWIVTGHPPIGVGPIQP